MLPTVVDIKEYLRIEGTEEDVFLGSLISVAQEDLADSGVTDKTSERYGLAIKLLVATHYEERSPEVVGTITTKLSYSLERIILQLKASELKLDSEM